MPLAQNLTLHQGSVSRSDRERLLGQRGCAVWLTGLSGSGKSTIAHALETRLHAERRLVYVLDGDNVRHGLSSDLGFSADDRQENIRRIGEVAALFVDAGVIVVAAFISPFRSDRDRVRQTIGDERFVEVFVEAPLAVCEQRDPKGLYQRARAGAVAEFTGISSPYEQPEGAALVLHTAESAVEQCVETIRAELERRGILRSDPTP